MIHTYKGRLWLLPEVYTAIGIVGYTEKKQILELSHQLNLQANDLTTK